MNTVRTCDDNDVCTIREHWCAHHEKPTTTHAVSTQRTTLTPTIDSSAAPAAIPPGFLYRYHPPRPGPL